MGDDIQVWHISNSHKHKDRLNDNSKGYVKKNKEEGTGIESRGHETGTHIHDVETKGYIEDTIWNNPVVGLTWIVARNAFHV